MIDLDELLAPLADGTLGDPLPIDEIRARAERRRRHGRSRRLAFVGAAAVVVLVMGAVAVLVSVDRPVRVETVPPAASTSVPSNEPTPTSPGLHGDPAAPLPVGNLPYDMVSSGSDLWVLNRFSNDVTRISTDTDEVRSTIALPGGANGAQPNRLALTDDAVWVAGAATADAPGGIARVDRATEAVTFPPPGHHGVVDRCRR